MSVNGCQDTVPQITAKTGLYLEGSVSPATSDVDVKILSAGKSSYTHLNKGDVATEKKKIMMDHSLQVPCTMTENIKLKLQRFV